MASFVFCYNLGVFFLFSAVALVCLDARSMDKTQDYTSFQYHKGALLTGDISINLIWYGKFKPSQRAIITDFVASLSSSRRTTTVSKNPSVATWWKTVEKYHHQVNKKTTRGILTLSLGEHILDEGYTLGKTLTEKNIKALAAKGGQSYAVNVVLTSADVAVQGFCMNRCGSHGSGFGSSGKKFAYIWIGNSETQCPGQCAWPFHAPVYGPQGPPLTAPNNDVGLDGIVINLASLLAGTATNPFGDGFYQGPKTAPLEAGSACNGIYGKGSYPGYAGELLVDATTGGSYNAKGINGRKYLLPALYDLETSACSTLF